MSWLDYTLLERPADRKTDTWLVRNSHNGSFLGEVRWHGPWRQYCWFPVDNTIWNAACLDELTTFIRERMKERKDGLPK